MCDTNQVGRPRQQTQMNMNGGVFTFVSFFRYFQQYGMIMKTGMWTENLLRSDSLFSGSVGFMNQSCPVFRFSASYRPSTP